MHAREPRTILAEEDGNSTQQVQRVAGKAIVLNLEYCAGLACHCQQQQCCGQPACSALLLKTAAVLEHAVTCYAAALCTQSWVYSMRDVFGLLHCTATPVSAAFCVNRSCAGIRCQCKCSLAIGKIIDNT